MSQVTLFDFEGSEIRVSGDSESPMFCLVDVCSVLAIGNPSDVLKRLKSDGVDSIEVIDSLGRSQSATFINEPNLYRVVFQSRKSNAQKFQDWIFEEVIPAIRKTGRYSVEQSKVKALPAYHEAAQTFDFISHVSQPLIQSGLDPLLVTSHVLSQTARLHPDVSPQIEAVKLLIPQQAQMQSADLLLNPTDVGKRLAPPISANAVNLLLTSVGLQIRTGIKDQPYELTELGREYGRVTLNQAKGSDKTVQHIKWKASVVQYLQERLAG